MKPLKLLMISGSVLIPLLFLLGGSYISEPGRLPNGSQRTVQTRAVESASLKVGKILKIGKKSDKNWMKSDKKSDKIGKSEKSDLI